MWRISEWINIVSVLLRPQPTVITLSFLKFLIKDVSLQLFISLMSLFFFFNKPNKYLQYKSIQFAFYFIFKNTWKCSRYIIPINESGFLCSIYIPVLLFFFRDFSYCCSSTVVSVFPPPLPPPHTHHHLSPSTSFGFVHGSFIHVPWWPFPLFPPLSLSLHPLVTVSLFFISMSLVLFCTYLFCLLGSTYRWGHVVFVFHHLAYFT